MVYISQLQTYMHFSTQMTMYSVPIERVRKTPSRKNHVSKNLKPKI